MYLKEIQMENFKSFKGKMRVPLVNGYTAITGPNGSGKSNISDAILFVLGPRSSKAIRAGRLTDLIFNGGKAGSAANFTKVSLIFDNSDKVLPVASDAVKLTRYVKKSVGKADYVSYFYVNDKKSSLNDFDSILSHAKISAEGYNLVQQGDITRIVEMGPKERRGILDDIAGISRFDADIESAEKDKLETEDNLDRIGIILEELRKQLKQLESDRASALKYREQKEKLDTAKAQLECKRKESLENEIEGLREQVGAREKEISKLAAEKDAQSKRLKDILKELDKAEKGIEAKSTAESAKLRQDLDALKVEVARCQDSIANSVDSISDLKVQRKQRKADMDKLVRESEGLAKDRAEIQKKHKAASSELQKARNEFETAEKKLAGSDSAATPLQKEVLAMKKREDDLTEKVRTLSVERDRLVDKAERQLREMEDLEEKKSAAEFQLKDAEWRLKELKSDGKKSSGNLKELQTKYFARRKEEEELTRQSIELEAAIKTLTRDYNQLKAETDAAKSVERGFSAAVNAILEARDKGELKGIHGTVAELIKLDKKFETAMATAAGNRMQAVIVNDDACAEKAIIFLKKNKVGRAMFLPISKMLPQRPRGKALMAVKGSLGFAIDLVEFKEDYRDAISYVLGDTIVVDGLEAARERMGGVRMVTLDGDLVEASGAMIGGMKERSMMKIGTSDRGQLDLVAENLRKATEKADKLSEKLKAVKETVLELEKQVKEAGMSDTSGSAVLDNFESHRKEFKDSIEKIKKQMKELEKETEQTSELGDSATSDLERFSVELAELGKKRQAKEQEMLALASRGLGKAMKELQERITALTKDEAESSGALGAFESRSEISRERMAEVKASLDSIESKLKSEEENIKAREKALAKHQSELRALQKIEDSMGSEIAHLRKARDDAYKSKTEMEASIDKLTHSMEAKNDFIRGLKMELENAGKRLAEAEEIVKKLDLKDMAKLPSTETLNKTIQSAEAAMQSMGNVNLRALDAYDEQQKRHDDLKEELGRLKEQRKRLIKLVDELNEKKKVGLLKVFSAVNEKFRMVYAELSEGGEAELLLENPDDPFSAGMLITARPPGKKVHRLEALSGGEKGVVSMALIFAIQRHDPSPFYMLDEVDQNLDAINAENVAVMVKKNSERAQFLQISLRKVTLKQADHIVGVTMQKKGISDIIMKVDLGDVKEPPQKAGPETGKGMG
ncbi:MAG: chromosome segregation protein SMC [Thermoplasmata archaeon]